MTNETKTINDLADELERARALLMCLAPLVAEDANGVDMLPQINARVGESYRVLRAAGRLS